MRKGEHSDLTAYARVRNTALTLFGEQGTRATSIRQIAKAVGVSPGLVQHHFPTKQALERAVAAHVASKMSELARAQPGPGRTLGTLTLGAAVIEFIRSNPEVVAYARRVILEDNQLGRELLDSMVGLSRSLNDRLREHGLLRSGLDPQWTVLNTMLLVLGPLLFEPAFDRYLEAPLRSKDGLARWDAAVEDLLVHGIYRHKTPSSKRPRSRRRGQ